MASNYPESDSGDEALADLSQSQLSITDEEPEKKDKKFFEQTKRSRGKVKHGILNYYLNGYFPILSSPNAYCKEIIYIDGFSGPGIYNDNDDEEFGSPLIVCQLIINHRLRHKLTIPIRLIFVDIKIDYTEKLRKNVKSNFSQGLPNKVTIEICNDTFEKKVTEVFEKIDKSSALLVFADPFGYKDVPMELMQKLVTRPKTELLINVMYQSAVRWFSDRKHQKPISRWLGMDESDWKKIVLLPVTKTAQEKRSSFMKLYIKQLQLNRPKDVYSLSFSIKSAINVAIYNLIFITGHQVGFKHMKRAMWNQSQLYDDDVDEFVFSEWVENKENIPVKKTPNEIAEDLRKIILKHFSGKETKGDILEKFIWFETKYAMNIKRELKKKLEKFMKDEKMKNWAFEKCEFDFRSPGFDGGPQAGQFSGGSQGGQFNFGVF